MDIINKEKFMTQKKPGDLVYFITNQISLLKTSSGKTGIVFVGPLVVYITIGKFQYILMDIEDKVLNGIFNFNRLKYTYLRAIKGPVSTLAELKQIINVGIRIRDQN